MDNRPLLRVAAGEGVAARGRLSRGGPVQERDPEQRSGAEHRSETEDVAAETPNHRNLNIGPSSNAHIYAFARLG